MYYVSCQKGQVFKLEDMEKRVYNIIYRIRRRSGSPDIRTKERTIFIKYGTRKEELSRPLLRRVYQFGFIVQYVIQ